MFKIDMHVHTTLGGDSFILPEELVDRARQAGLDGVCVTEHHSYHLSEPFEAIRERSGFPIFRGLEYSAAEGHLLIYGARLGREELPLGSPMQEVIHRVNALGGVAVPAHPFQVSLLGASLGERLYALTGLSCIEAINASATPAENRRAQVAAGRMNLAGIAGSDAHGLPLVGRACTLFPGPVRCMDELVVALKCGDVRPYWNEPAPATCHRG